MSELTDLAGKLGISDAQLARLQYKFRQKHDDAEADENLLAWMKSAASEHRDRRWLLSRHPSSFVEDQDGKRHYGYTESPSEAMAENEEGVPPAEIENYRHSRQAEARYVQERHAEVEDLLAAMTELRAAINSMPRERTRRMGRSFWILRSRLDAADRDLRRRLAA